MKILFDHPLPFALAHGGFQTQIEQTKTALEKRGVEVEHVRWWDDRQTGDLIHYFGRPHGGYIDFAHKKGLKVIIAELHTGLGSRPAWARALQKALMRGARMFLPKTFTGRLSWDAYRKGDAFIALTEWEAHLIRSMFDADPAKVHVIPNGVEPVFFRSHAGGSYLVCTAALHPRKRVLELAAAAVQAQVPVWIIGKPYSESESYYQSFLEIQKKNPDCIRYEGAIADRAQLAEIYSAARGFVLLSTQESLSLSALEAAAAGCPLLLSDLPWARGVFGSQASYMPLAASPGRQASILADFFKRAPSLPATFKPLLWEEIADSFVVIYQGLFKPFP